MKNVSKWIVSAILSFLCLVIVYAAFGRLDALFSYDREVLIRFGIPILLIIRVLIFAIGRAMVHYGKSTCKICGFPAGSPTMMQYPISDGFICHSCFRKLGYHYWAFYPFKRVKSMPSELVRDRIDARMQALFDRHNPS